MMGIQESVTIRETRKHVGMRMGWPMSYRRPNKREHLYTEEDTKRRYVSQDKK